MDNDKKPSNEKFLSQYILKNLPKNSTIGMDLSLFIQETAFNLKTKIVNCVFIDDINNLIDDIWGII